MSGSFEANPTVATGGTRGLGGDGGNGGASGSGGGGNNTNLTGCCSLTGGRACGNCEVGAGGQGGRGGDGGNGGNGQPGAAGRNWDIVNNGVAFNTTSAVPTSPLVGIQYSNTKICRNSVISLTSNAAAWDPASFGSGFDYVNDMDETNSSYSASSTPVEIFTTVENQDADVVDGVIRFDSYLQIEPDPRDLPVITLSSPEICVNQTMDLTASAWGTEVEYEWEIYNTAMATGAPVWSSSLEEPTTTAFTTPGDYLVRYQVREECCGWSVYVFERFTVNPDIADNNIENGPITACTDDDPIMINEEMAITGGGTGAITYQWEYSTNLVDYFPATGASATDANINVADEGLAAGTYYFRRIVSRGGCTSTSDIAEVDLQNGSLDPTALTASVTQNCGPVEVDFDVTGGALGDNANWVLYQGDPNAGGVIIRTGTNPTIDFAGIAVTETNTFYVQAEGGCRTSAAASVPITIDSPSTDPTSLTPDVVDICGTGDAVLTLGGGSLGTGAQWYLYDTDPTVGTPTPIDNNMTGIFNVTGISSTTTYYVQGEGDCNTTIAQNVTINQYAEPVAPFFITASPLSSCGPTTVSISPAGGALGSDGEWTLYAGDPDAGGTFVANSSTAPISTLGQITTTTTFYLRVESAQCGNTTAANVTVTISEPPTATSPNIAELECLAAAYDLTQHNTTVNAGGTVTWYDGDPDAGGTVISPDNAVDLNSISNLYAYVDDGTCTNSVTVSPFIVPTVSPTPTISGPVEVCDDGSIPISLTVDQGYPVYSWSTTDMTQSTSINAGGTYTVTVTDGIGCTGTAAQTVAAIPCPVPVELLDFIGYAEDRYNVLKWRTASEENTEFHIIERSPNGTDDFQEIGRLDAAGFSIEVQSYELLDEQPLDLGYYRVKSLDFDGAYEYSNVISIKRENNGFNFVSVFPNPTKEGVTIQFTSDTSKDIHMTVFNMAGQLVFRNTFPAGSGTNSVGLDMTNFASGTYQIRLFDGSNSILEKVVKQ